MITAADIMSDADVAKLIGVALSTFQKWLRTDTPNGSILWEKAHPVMVGGRRRWLRSDIEKILKERITK